MSAPEPTPSEPSEPTPEPTPGETEPTEPEPAEPTEPAGETEPDDEGEEGDEGEPEPEPEPEQGDEQARQSAILSEKEMRAGVEKLENEATRHANRVSEIMGEDALALVPCELCSPHVPGFRWDKQPPEEQVTAVRAAIGMPSIENLKEDYTTRPCDKCDGSGKVRTGSHVQGQETLPCFQCKGKGWVAVGSERMAPQAPEVPGAEVPALAAVPDDGIKRDMFGTPEGDPDYGLMPNLRARPITYWQESQGQGV